MVSVAEIISSLPGMGVSDLRQIQAALTHELEKHLTIDSDLFHMIIDELGERHISAVKFARSKTGPLWKNGETAFTSVLQSITQGGTYTRVQLTALKKFMVTLLLEDLRERGHPINIRSVCYALADFGNIYERAFPGYRKNQLGPLIMAKLGGSYGNGEYDPGQD